MKILTSLLAVILLTSTSLFALKPQKEYKVLPDEFGLAYDKLTIPTKDNMQLAAWLFKAPSESKKVIILSYNGEGNMSKMIEMASQFLTLGYNVITYDYRGYGESSEFKINNNFYMYAQFEKDLNAVIDYTRKYYSKFRQLDLYGQGMGAGLSIAIGCNRSEVNKIIADSPYNTLESVQKRIKEIKNEDVMIPLAFDKYLIEPEYAVAERGKNVAGILIIWGEKEEICAQKDVRVLRKLAKCPTTDYKVLGATAENTFSINKPKYLEELKNFTK
ncbi:MAG: alpha/beta hydrolase [Bacteroidetes bacterium]|nr:alpha/beta hydrolase [Bacteroidota bacterium]